MRYQQFDAWQKTAVDYFVGEHGFVNISVYDIKGSLVEELISGHMISGPGKVSWIANDLSSGVYFIRMQNGSGQLRNTQVTLIK